MRNVCLDACPWESGRRSSHSLSFGTLRAMSTASREELGGAWLSGSINLTIGVAALSTKWSISSTRCPPTRAMLANREPTAATS